MNNNREIYRLELDLSDFEAKAKRAAALIDEIQAKRSKKEDTSDLEKELDREVGGLGELINAQNDAAKSTEGLIKHKSALSAVVRALGGDLGGMASGVGNLVSMLSKAGPQGLIVAAVIASLSAAWNAANKALAEYVAKMEHAAELHSKMASERLGAREKAADMLEKVGVSGAAGDVAARAARMSREQGIDEDVAMFGATAALIGGLDESSTRRAMQGYLISGRKSQFSGNRAADAALINEMVVAGGTPEAEAFFAGRIADVGEIVKARTAVAPESEKLKAFAEKYELLVRQTARIRGMNDADINKLMLLSKEPLGWDTLSEPGRMRRLFKENWDDIRGTDLLQWLVWNPHAFNVIKNERLEGGTQKLWDLKDMAYDFQQRAAAAAEEAPLNKSQPVMINQVNIGTANLRGDSGLRPSLPSIAISRGGTNLHKTPLGF